MSAQLGLSNRRALDAQVGEAPLSHNSLRWLPRVILILSAPLESPPGHAARPQDAANFKHGFLYTVIENDLAPQCPGSKMCSEKGTPWRQSFLERNHKLDGLRPKGGARRRRGNTNATTIGQRKVWRQNTKLRSNPMQRKACC